MRVRDVYFSSTVQTFVHTFVEIYPDLYFDIKFKLMAKQAHQCLFANIKFKIRNNLSKFGI